MARFPTQVLSVDPISLAALSPFHLCCKAVGAVSAGLVTVVSLRVVDLRFSSHLWIVADATHEN